MTATMMVGRPGNPVRAARSAAGLLIACWVVAVVASYVGDASHGFAPKLITAFLLWLVWREVESLRPYRPVGCLSGPRHRAELRDHAWCHRHRRAFPRHVRAVRTSRWVAVRAADQSPCPIGMFG